MPEASRLAAALADRYRIERELGQGGMATVYLAQDLKHDRKVAVKVLRPELAAVIGAERFLSEIKTTANLQHPHILPLFDSGAVDSFLFYVMPYVEGESLRDRLNREKQLPITDAIRIATEVASALDYAHRHNVIHRDIKPENILLHVGQAIVADFGIALAVNAAGGSRMTETGLSLGTPGYMSPEQAMGEREITARSDVYALGCVTYEMLLGEPPFTGPTAQAIVAKVMTETPAPLIPRRGRIPPAVEDAVLTALEKLPADRFANGAEFVEAMAGGTTGRRYDGKGARGATNALPLYRRPAFLGTLLAVAGVGLGLGIARLIPTPPIGRGLARFTISTGGDVRLSYQPVHAIALSPDGSLLAYASETPEGGQLALRRMDALSATLIPGTELGSDPFFSPDGAWLGFVVRDELRKVPLDGSAPATIVARAAAGRGVWTRDGTIVYPGTDSVLWEVPDGGGTPKPFAPVDRSMRSGIREVVGLLSDGKTLLTMGSRLGIGSRARISAPLLAVERGSGRTTVVLDSVMEATYTASGYLVFGLADGSLRAAPLDAGSLRVGRAVTVAQAVFLAFNNFAQFATSDANTLAYIPAPLLDLVMVDRRGTAQPPLGATRQYHSPRFSPDGRRVAVDITQPGSRDVWIQDLKQGTLSRLTFENGAHDPVWTPDGRRLAYLAPLGDRMGLLWRPADGSGTADSLLLDHSVVYPGTWMPDGHALISVLVTPSNGRGLYLAPVPRGAVQPIAASRFTEEYPALSPDGRWLAYGSDESGQMEIYLRPVSDPKGRIQVSLDGGTEPVWARSGRELFYRHGGPGGAAIVAAAVQTSPALQITARTKLFDAQEFEPSVIHANYDISPDGARFVMLRKSPTAEIIMVQDWGELVRSGQTDRTR